MVSNQWTRALAEHDNDDETGETLDNDEVRSSRSEGQKVRAKVLMDHGTIVGSMGHRVAECRNKGH